MEGLTYVKISVKITASKNNSHSVKHGKPKENKYVYTVKDLVIAMIHIL